MKALSAYLLIVLGLHSGLKGQDTTIQLQTTTIISFVDAQQFAGRTIHLDPRMLHLYRSQSLSRILNQSTPVFMKEYGPGVLATPSIRGGGAGHSLLSWEGIVLNSPMLGTSDFSQAGMGLFDGLTLNLGTSSLRKSSGGLGGLITLKDGGPDPRVKADGRNQLLFQQDLASFGTISSFGKFATSGKRYTFDLRQSWSQSDNDFIYPDPNSPNGETLRRPLARQNLWEGRETFRYALDPRNLLTVSAWHRKAFRELPPALLAQDQDESQWDDFLRARLAWEFEGVKTRYVRVQAAWLQDNFRYRNGNAGIDDKSQSRQAVLQAYAWHMLGKGFLEMQGRTLYETASSDGFAQDKSRIRGEANLGYQKVVSRLKYGGGVRQVYSSDINEMPTLPYAGIEYFRNKSKWYASAGRNVRIPTLNDLYWSPGGNPALVPEHSWSVEAGLKSWQWRGKTWRGDMGVSVFRNEVRDWILWVPNGNIWEAQNVQSVRAQGAELHGEFIFRKGWNIAKINAHYSYTSARQKDSQSASLEGKQLIYTPHHLGKLRISWDHFNWTTYVGLNYTGRRFVTSDNSLALPAYVLPDLSIGYRIRRRGSEFLVQAWCRNLGNDYYEAVVQRPMPGRNYALSLTWDWNRNNAPK